MRPASFFKLSILIVETPRSRAISLSALCKGAKDSPFSNGKLTVIKVGPSNVSAFVTGPMCSDL